jgi:hypothetical protein
MLTVVCLKWGTAFPAASVTVLYNAVRRHLDIPFRFTCFTDDPSGLAPGIEARPIADIGLPPERWRSGCWPKLTIFKPGILGGADLAVYCDLDIVIQAPLAPFLERAAAMGGLHIIREWHKSIFHFLPLWFRPNRGGQSAFFVWRPSEQKHIFETFAADPETAYRIDGNDQRYITRVAMNLHYWPDGWCVSFRRTCLWSRPFNFLFSVRRPRDAKLVVFHGIPRPWDLVLEGNQRWGTKWKFGFGPVGWVKDYWERGLGAPTADRGAPGSHPLAGPRP